MKGIATPLTPWSHSMWSLLLPPQKTSLPPTRRPQLRKSLLINRTALLWISIKLTSDNSMMAPALMPWNLRRSQKRGLTTLISSTTTSRSSSSSTPDGILARSLLSSNYSGGKARPSVQRANPRFLDSEDPFRAGKLSLMCRNVWAWLPPSAWENGKDYLLRPATSGRVWEPWTKCQARPRWLSGPP